ncbi:MAG: T9SS type A sorting domain-containing protein, partial [Candidatus Azobacteroides sp.]|nr:T9SS type A sorting domain-containing protein [Candidatus Azobacteroides sp.]
YIDGNAIYSSETSYPKQADLNTWTTKSYSLAGATAGNTFVLGIGMSTNKGDYYITNVRLKAKTSTTPSTEYFTISDFESYTIGDIGTVFSKWNRPSDGAVTIVADPAPAGTNGKSANIVTTDYDTFLGLNVTLPSGTTLDDYTDILFDIYIGANPGDSNPNYKNMFVYIDGNAFYSSETSYPKQADLNTWTTKSYSLTGATAGNTFVLGIGMSTNTGDYYIDNVKLKAKAGTVEIIPQYTIGKSYVSNNVLFVGDAQAEKVFVYDINGKLQILKQNVSTVELDNLAKGVYIAKIIAGGQAQTIKFIK